MIDAEIRYLRVELVGIGHGFSSSTITHIRTIYLKPCLGSITDVLLESLFQCRKELTCRCVFEDSQNSMSLYSDAFY